MGIAMAKMTTFLEDYPPATWRLLLTPPLDGATNMAVDEAVLYALAEGHGRPTLRFYAWQPACLSLGYNQHWREVDEEAVARRGYTWTRRPTGGKAILHTDELTYSVIVPLSDPCIQGGITASYLALSHGLLNGLVRLGVAAEQERGQLPARDTPGRRGPVCFDTPSLYEITWRGKKLLGSAQLRRKKILLQHGTLPLRGDLRRILGVLHLTEEERARQELLLPTRAATLEEVLGRVVPFAAAATAMAAGLAQQLNVTLAEAPLTPQEEALAERLRAAQYANDQWNKRV
jgi:lipoate-protein ligase A